MAGDEDWEECPGDPGRYLLKCSDIIKEPYLVKRKEIFTVWAPENPETGFTWNVKIDPEGDCGVEALTLLEVSYKAQPYVDGERAKGGARYMKFRVNSNAEQGKSCKLYFSYAKPWTMTEDWFNSARYAMEVKVQEGEGKFTGA